MLHIDLDDLYKLLPNGPYSVVYEEKSDEDISYIIGLLVGPNGQRLLVDDNPLGYGKVASPILEYLCALDRAYRANRNATAEAPLETAGSWADSGPGGCDVQAGDDPAPVTGRRPNETTAEYGRRLQVEEYEGRMNAPTGPVAVLTLRPASSANPTDAGNLLQSVVDLISRLSDFNTDELSSSTWNEWYDKVHPAIVRVQSAL